MRTRCTKKSQGYGRESEKIKYILILVAVIGFGFCANAHNRQDVVYLKNGSIIRGIIIEQVPNQSIKIETADGNTFVYQIDEIAKMTKEMSRRTGTDSYRNSSFYETEPGYSGSVNLGYAFEVGDYGVERLKLHVVNGYRFNPYFYLGFGTGLNYYSDADAAVLPLFVNFKVDFLRSRVLPYFSLDAGYSFDLTNSFEPVGLLLNPKIGVSFKLNEKNAMNVGLGFDMQWMDFLYSYGYYYNYYYTSNEMSGAISLNVGFSF